MSNMLGRTGPWEQHCCTRHSGKYRMTGKRRNEERQWRSEADEELHQAGKGKPIGDGSCVENSRGFTPLGSSTLPPSA